VRDAGAHAPWIGERRRHMTKLDNIGDRKQDPRYFRILVVAIKIFAEQGYENTNLDMIADRALVSKATIYNFFRDKSDLFKHAVIEVFSKRFVDIRKSLEGDGDILDILSGFAYRYLDAVFNPATSDVAYYETLRLIVAATYRDIGTVREFIDEFNSSCFNPIKEYLSSQIEKNRLPAMDTDAATTLFFQIIFNSYHLYYDPSASPAKEDLRTEVTKRTRIFLRACEVLAEEQV